jgi:glycosyltransferase involved in cell wall biosynthesis
MQRALWLASWYPDSRNPFDGDFVQRHANALATQMPVHVICVKPRYENHDGQTERNAYENLTEEIRYYTKSNLPVIGGLVSLVRYVSTGIKAINDHRKKNGNVAFIHVHVPMKAGLVALWQRLFNGVPYVITEHYNIYHARRDDSFFSRSWFYRFAVQLIFKRSNGLVTVSNYIADQIKTVAPNINSMWVPNCVDTTLFYPEPRQHSKSLFVHASTMQPVKNISGILQAVKLLSERRNDFELHLMGPFTNDIKTQIESLGLNGLVTLYGEVSYDKVAEVTRSADALVMFSRWENMPCNILEALCCGLPIVATRVGGIPEVVHESNCMLVESDDVNALVDAMNTMIEHRTDLDKSQIAATASARFGYKPIGQQLVEAYNRLIPNKAKS